MISFPLPAVLKKYIPLGALLLGGLLFATLTSAHADESCTFFAEAKAAQTARPVAAKTIRAMSDWQTSLYQSMERSAKALYRDYRAGKIEAGTVESCLAASGLANDDVEDFKALLPRVFMNESLAELGRHSGPKTKNFVLTLQNQIKTGSFVFFRLTGHFHDETSPTDEKGGFHRANRSIFMDFSRIPPNEWLVIFAHEHAHSLDPEISNALPVYADQPLVKSIVAAVERVESKKSADPAKLSPAELADLDRWLIAGLNRSFLAEVRAWALSYEIYTEGVHAGAWAKIDWMERMLADQKSGESSLDYAIRYLSPRFTDPDPQATSNRIFSRPLIQRRLKQLRAAISQGKVPVSSIL